MEKQNGKSDALDVLDKIKAKQGDGLSNVTVKDVMIPRIKLLQKMSPEVDDAGIPNAKAGENF